MFMTMQEAKEVAPRTQSMGDYASSLPEDELTLILRDYNEPTTPPYLDSDAEVYDFEQNPRPKEDIAAAYGIKPNVPATNVINAIKAAIGPGGYALHISDGSYTGYSIWEVNEYIRNFESSNLIPYVPEAFDCDDFSQCLQGTLNRAFPGIALGTIWYGPKNPPYNWGHSVNIFYSYSNNRIYLIEPQNDAFFAFDKNKWRAWMIIM